MSVETKQFCTAAEMPYTNSEEIKIKAQSLFKVTSEHLKNIKKDKLLSFNKGETVYIPDIHGDFIHLIFTLYRHGVLTTELNLKKEYQYVFLGDIYDRSPDSDVIDHWINIQIKNKIKIYRLIGNHEMAFFERDPNGYPVIFPSQDSIKDISNDFLITESLLKNIASGNILAAYVDRRNAINHVSTVLYVHSYIINEDYKELGLDINTNVVNFAYTLNNRLQIHGQYAYDLFCQNKEDGKYDWKAIMKSFHDDLLFNMYKKKNDISTSFIWRRTSLPVLNTFHPELEIDIPDNVYQIVGHTPVFSFSLPQEQPINKPFVISAKDSTGKIQFSDVGIGYYYKSELERPEVFLQYLFSSL